MISSPSPFDMQCFMPTVSSMAATGNLVSTSRRARGREVHAHTIRFAAANSGARRRTSSTGEQQTDGVVGVLHRNAGGWLAISLNADGEPVSPALTDMRGYTSVRTKRVERNLLVGSLVGRLGVRHVYTNDASLLTSSDTARLLGDAAERLEVNGYQGSFVHGLETAKRRVLARREAAAAAAAAATAVDARHPEKRCDREQPSYESIRELDPSISRAEYRRIYGIARDGGSTSKTKRQQR